VITAREFVMMVFVIGMKAMVLVLMDHPQQIVENVVMVFVIGLVRVVWVMIAVMRLQVTP
jgi:hypothetical protein